MRITCIFLLLSQSHRVSGSLHAHHSHVGWVISGCVPKTVETFQLITDENSKDNDSNHEFDERTDDEKLTVSNDDRLAMEIVERTIQCVNHYKFQIAVPFRHINPNMPDNYQQAASRINQQRRTLCKSVKK